MRRVDGALITLLLVVACTSAPPAGPSSAPLGSNAPQPLITPGASPSLTAPAAQLTEYRSTVSRDPITAATGDALNAVVASDEEFATRLYGQLASGDGNVFMSPYSISTSLSMVLAGARGETATQLAQVLAIDDTKTWDSRRNRLDQTIGTVNAMQSISQGEAQPLVLETANTMFGQTGYPFEQQYLDVLARDYGSSVQGVDFENAWEQARLAINDWVASQTNQRIKDLLARGTIDTYTRAVLVNAIYFKANWIRQFSPAATQDAPFHLLNGSSVEVPAMHYDGASTGYAEGNGWAATQLPYYGASMLVIVPNDGKFATVERGLDPEFIAAVDSGMGTRSLTLSLPKFNTEQSADLKDALERLGATDLFTDGADLTGITTADRLFISHVAHKANISVDEQGTEAAAATASVAEASSLPPPATLNVDRPFIYLIRDTATNEILFMGRVVDPS